jgi:hypothetical protein
LGSTTTNHNCFKAPLTVSEKQTSQNGTGSVRNSLGLQCSDLDAVKSGHELCGNLCHPHFSHQYRVVLLVRLENVLKRASIPGCATGPEQLCRQGGSCQQDQNRQKCAELVKGGFTVTYVEVWGDEKTRTTKAASKTKYTCHECQANAWAKPDTNLICGDCDQVMEAE